MRKSSEETGLYWGTKPRSMTLGVRDLAFVGTAVAGIAAAFISRRKARQTDLRNAALLQSLEERNRAVKSLEEEQAKILSQLNDASTKAGISDSTCSDLKAELEGVQKQLTQKAQEHELAIQKIENERDQAKSALETLTSKLETTEERLRITEANKQEIVALVTPVQKDIDKLRRKLARKDAQLRQMQASDRRLAPSEAESPMTARSIDSNSSHTPVPNGRVLREMNFDQSPLVGFGERAAKAGAEPV